MFTSTHSRDASGGEEMRVESRSSWRADGLRRASALARVVAGVRLDWPCGETGAGSEAFSAAISHSAENLGLVSKIHR